MRISICYLFNSHLMNRYFFILFFTISFITIGYAQNTQENLIFKYLDYGKLSDKDYKNSIKKFRELILDCKNQGYYNVASMCYYNIGHLYLKQGQYELARTEFKQGIEIGEKSKEQSGTAINLAGLGWILQDLNSETLGNEYIQKGIALLESNKHYDEFKYMVLGKLYTISGFSKTNRSDSLEIRIININKAISSYNKSSSKYFSKDALLSESYISLASVKQDLGQYKAAIFNLRKAEYYNKLKIMHTSEVIYLGLTGNYMLIKEYDSAIIYGKRTLEILDKEGNDEPEVRLKLYGYMREAYKSIDNEEMFARYSSLYMYLENEINKSKLKVAGKINVENSMESEKKSMFDHSIFMILGSLLLLLLIGMIYYQRKHRQEVKAFKNFRKTIKEKREDGIASFPIKEFKHEEFISSDIPENQFFKGLEEKLEDKANLMPIQSIRLEEAISNETEKQLLKRLEKFEKKKGFTQKGITQSKLAGQLHTNVRYLSIVIKKYKKEKNFSTYLNILRINYIVDKIEKDNLYRKYKISYLADECGYPTSSSFTKAFSEITGVTPSAYINLLNQEEQGIGKITD